jgi:purine-nucleoside phosphorylase
MHRIEHIKNATDYIQQHIKHSPSIGLILGSGLGSLADEIKNPVTLPYQSIPHFAKSEAIGHANQLVIGELEGKMVVAMKGRFHYYEGYSLDEVTFPVRVMKALGVKTIIITNACGAVNQNFKPGELMIIRDHINLVGSNPLIGKNNDALGTRFPDLSKVYDSNLRTIAKSVAREQNLPIHEGVYTWWSGPAYETPAEIKMIRVLGGDAVGMSTVPEAIVATHAKMKVLGISCLTNMASGILEQPLHHQEVIDVANQVKQSFIQLMVGIIRTIE